MEDLKVIQEYKEKYAYSPVFAALYAKVLHNLKDLKYDEALRDAAIILPERSVLYHLIYKEPLQEKISSVQEITSISKEEEFVKEKQTVEEDLKESVVELDEETKELEQDVLLEAINSTIQLDVDQLLEEEVSDSIEDWKDNSEDLVEEKIVSPSKFSDWLFAMKGADASVEKEKEKQPDLLSSKELIDKFIKAKPRKIDISKDPVTPQEMGKLSLVEDEGFVTETLAEIYAKQGKYQKAIKIYEQLSLNNPEKKVFFASRIRFLREKLEYDK